MIETIVLFFMGAIVSLLQPLLTLGITVYGFMMIIQQHKNKKSWIFVKWFLKALKRSAKWLLGLVIKFLKLCWKTDKTITIGAVIGTTIGFLIHYYLL